MSSRVVAPRAELARAGKATAWVAKASKSERAWTLSRAEGVIRGGEYVVNCGKVGVLLRLD